MTAHQRIGVLDYGAQYSQLFARRVRACNVCGEINNDLHGIHRVTYEISSKPPASSGS